MSKSFRLATTAMCSGAIALGLWACGAEKGDEGAGMGTGGAGASSGNGNGTRDDGGIVFGNGNGGLFADALNGPPMGNGPNAGDPVCGLKKVDLQRLPADLMIVLDRSGSMLDPAAPTGQRPPAGTPSKWSEVSGAVAEVVTTTQMNVGWGLKMFPMGGSCSVAKGVEVPLAANNAMAVNGGMTPPQQGNGTPTTEAMLAATTWLSGRKSMNPKYILLATDGLPTCRNGDGSPRGHDEDAAIKAIKDAAAAGFPTFVVGIAVTGTAETTLNQMADAGKMPRNDPMHRYYPVATKGELVQALTSITGQVASCTFTLEKAPPDPTNVAVDVDGARVPASATDGWAYGSGNTSIVLNGSWCDKLKSGAAKTAQITFGCAGMPIP